MLVGRESERSALDALLQSARGERSAALVLRGEAGIGKTALLEYAADSARDMTVLRCVGIEAEYELPFAGMHQLVRPCLELVDRLPAPQAAALRGALGLSFDGVQDRFLVSAGLLSLLAEACDARPGAVLRRRRTVARPALGRGARVRRAALRSRADRAAHGRARRRRASLRCAGAGRARGRRPRRPERPRPAQRPPGSPGGARRRRTPPADRSRQSARAARAALGAQRGAARRRGADRRAAAGARRGRGRLRRARGAPARRRARACCCWPPPTRPATLATVQRAAERLGLALSDLDDAEREELVRVDGAVTFRHPLVRSAVYRAATRSERREAHEALAAAVSDPVSGAWHRAVVADRPDEALAGELEAAAAQAVGADGARHRGGHLRARRRPLRGRTGARPAPARRRPGVARRRAPGRRAGARRACAPAHRGSGRRGAPRSHPRHGGRAPGLARRRLHDAARRGPCRRGCRTRARHRAGAVVPVHRAAGRLGRAPVHRGAETSSKLIDSDGPLGRFADELVEGLSAYFAGRRRDGRRTIRRDARDRSEPRRPADGRHAGVRVGVHRRLATRARALHARGRAAARRGHRVGAGRRAAAAWPSPSSPSAACARRRPAWPKASSSRARSATRTTRRDCSGCRRGSRRCTATPTRAARTRRRHCAAACVNGIGWATTNARLALAELELGPRRPARGDRPFRSDRPHAGPAAS